MDLSSFNPNQLEAVTLSHKVTELRDILIVAGAGSGKTRVVVYRIAYLITKLGINPKNILGVTFTNKAAKEMQTRLRPMFKRPTPIKLGTFHAIAADLLRTFSDINFEILDQSDQKRMIRNVVKDAGLKDEVSLKELNLWLSVCRNGCYDPKIAAPNDSVTITAYRRVARLYEEAKKALGGGVYDFDDLLEKLVELLESKPAIQKALHARWKYILVDEYQDTNKRQFQIIELLRGEETQLLQVGDEDQLIYSWRGADISHILSSYQKSLKNNLVKCIMLDKNYRSTSNILDLASAVISNNVQRTEKVIKAHKTAGEPVKLWEFRDCSSEAHALAQQCERWSYEGYDYTDMAILIRTNRMSKQLERAFIRQGVPYKLHNGLALFDSKEVGLLMALLWFTENPNEFFYFQGVLEYIKIGVGMEKILMLDEERRAQGKNWIEFLSEHPKLAEKSRVKELIMFYNEAMPRLKRGDISAAARGWLNDWDLMQFFKKEERETKTENLMVFFSVIDDYEHDASVKNEEVTLSNFQEQRLLNDSLTDDDTDGVNIMTIHKSKGLEFKVGAIVGIQDGVFPMGNSSFEPEDEEDWRLAYVAITRFMVDLVLTRAGYRIGYKGIDQYSSIIDMHISPLEDKEALVCEQF